MRTVIPTAVAVLTMTLAVPALGQPAAEPSVEGYLCVFAGKCSDVTESAQTALSGDGSAMDNAPAEVTEGFRIAGPTPSGKKAQVAVAAVRGRATPTRDLVAKLPRNQSVSGENKRGRRSKAAANATQSYSNVLGGSNAGGGHTAPAGTPRADLMIGFKLNSAQITLDGQAKARIFAKSLVMPELIGKRFLIEGHTDSLGTIDANMDLSRRRAEAVAAFLSQQGVQRSRIEVRGFGPSVPLPGQPSSDTRNRRVEARLIP